MGNSTTKKEAQANAAKDFVSYLIRQGLVKQNELSDQISINAPKTGDDFDGNNAQNQLPARPVFQVYIGILQSDEMCISLLIIRLQEGMGPDEMGAAYRPWGGQRNDHARPPFVDSAQQAKIVEEAESADMNSAIHGNWTLENAKSKLHQFMQTNKISSDYSFKAVGEDHSR